MAKKNNKHKKKINNTNVKIKKDNVRSPVEKELLSSYNSKVKRLNEIKKNNPKIYKKAMIRLVSMIVGIVVLIVMLIIVSIQINTVKLSDTPDESESFTVGKRVDEEVDVTEIYERQPGDKITVTFDDITTPNYMYTLMMKESDSVITETADFDEEYNKINTKLSLDSNKLYTDKTDKNYNNERVSLKEAIVGLEKKSGNNKKASINFDNFGNGLSKVDDTDKEKIINYFRTLGNSYLISPEKSFIYYNSIYNGSSAYFQDMLIRRYVSDNEKLKVVCTVVSNHEIDSMKQIDLDKSIKASIDLNEIRLPTTLNINENEYIAAIYDCISYVIKTGKVVETENKTIVSDYMTDTGLIETLKLRDLIKCNEDYNTYFRYGKIGKSEINLENKNRAYIQFEVQENILDEAKVVNIMAKLNSDNKIFDIDIL